MKIKVKEILENLYSDKAFRVVENRDNYYVILDNRHNVYEVEYEDDNWNTNVDYVLSREDAQDRNYPHARTEPVLREISIYEFLIKNSGGMYNPLKEELADDGKILILDDRGFEKWTKDKVSGEDYVVFNKKGERQLTVRELINGGAEPLKQWSDRKYYKMQDKLYRHFGVDDIYQVKPKKLIKYAKSSVENYKKVQRLYKKQDRTVLHKDDEIRYWEKVNKELRFPDNVNMKTELPY